MYKIEQNTTIAILYSHNLNKKVKNIYREKFISLSAANINVHFHFAYLLFILCHKLGNSFMFFLTLSIPKIHSWLIIL